MATRVVEIASCTRCGIRRAVNLGKARKARSTGLCRDCYLLEVALGGFKQTCPVCKQTFTHGGPFIAHYQSHDPDRIWVCPLCERVLRCRGTHPATHHKTDPSSQSTEHTHP